MCDGNILDFLGGVVETAKKAGATAADAILIDTQSLSVDWRADRLESLERAESVDFGLRVLVGQRQAVVSSADRSRQAINDLIERAVNMARVIPEDQWAGLAAPDQISTARPIVNNHDPARPSVQWLMDAAAAAEDAARAVPGVVNSEGSAVGYQRCANYVVASNGFSHSFETSSFSISATALVGDDAIGMERDYDYAIRTHLSDLPDPVAIGRNAGQRAIRRLNAAKVAVTTVPVVFDSRCARSLVSHFCAAINGENVACGMSFLQDHMGKSVFASGVSIVEDPFLERGLRSSPVDAEGLAKQKMRLIDNGVLSNWILDLGTSRRLGSASNGHASRGVSSPPSPTVSNVWMEPGAQSPQQMIAEIQEGLYVTDLFGRGVNGLTGDYSCGCSGMWIKNGEFAGAVNEITIAGDLKEMFKTLMPASDLTIEYGIDAPTARIDAMSVSGTS